MKVLAFSIVHFLIQDQQKATGQYEVVVCLFFLTSETLDAIEFIVFYKDRCDLTTRMRIFSNF